MGWKQKALGIGLAATIAAYFPRFSANLPDVHAETPQQKFQLLFPTEGSIMTLAYDAQPFQQGMQVPLLGLAPSGSKVWFNNQPAKPLKLYPGEHRRFSSYLEVIAEDDEMKCFIHQHAQTINTRKNDLFLSWLDTSSPITGQEILTQHKGKYSLFTPRLYYDARAEKTCSVTIDDTADALAELAATQPVSLFHHPTFKFLKGMHEKYNAVFSLYLFYEGTLYKEFNLSKMPTQYEQEWEENSSWLKLGFHAQRMHPAYPYQTASYQQAKDDFLAVKSQVLRFASEKSWDEMMCSHYWSGSLESCRAWRDLGIKGFYAAHQARQSYYLPKELSQFLNLLDFFYDAQEGNLFIQTDIWMERDFPTTPNLEHSTHQKLHALAQENPLGMHNIHLFTHESYLLPQNHFHKMREKLEAALSWLVSQGYKQEFDGENPFFNMLPPPAPFHLKKISQGENALLVWERREKEPCTYLLYKKTLSHPHGEPGEWLEMGKTNQQSWLLNAQEKEEWAAYKVAAVLGEKQSISNPFILEPEPLKEELTIKLYPNPFNQSATMQYSLPEAAEVSMSIYNLLGQRIRQFPRELQAAGHYWQEIDAENLASGIYIVELMAGKQRATKKMLLLK